MITLDESGIIFEIIQLATIQSEVNIPITDDIIIHRVFNSLLMEYEQLKISYNAQRVKWGMDELI